MCLDLPSLLAEPRPLPPGEIDLQRTELEPCTYSLFDLKRGKYLVTEWSLTRLVTQAKVKKWCARPQDYLVFHSPHDHCRRYYKDLCHVSGGVCVRACVRACVRVCVKWRICVFD